MTYKGKKPAASLAGCPQNMVNYIQPLAIAFNIITGASSGELKGLKSTATNEEIIKKINEIIARINSSGEAK